MCLRICGGGGKPVYTGQKRASNLGLSVTGNLADLPACYVGVQTPTVALRIV